MKYTQNHKIRQITKDTLIIGIDIAKKTHFARAIDFQNLDCGSPLEFNNDMLGFENLQKWAKDTMQKYNKNHVIYAMEPTGHYWFNLARRLISQEEQVVTVNPMHVKLSKEFEDNLQTKSDFKDARIIALLAKDGRFIYAAFEDGYYEELKNLSRNRDRIMKNINRLNNQIIGWLDQYFPELVTVFKEWNGQTAIFLLKTYQHPQNLANRNPQEIFDSLPKNLRRIGQNKIEKLISVCQTSAGITQGLKTACFSLQTMLTEYELLQKNLKDCEDLMFDIGENLPEVHKLKNIKGINMLTACTLIAELGDVRKFKDPQQLIKMAGLSLVSHSSGAFRGRTTISKRGRNYLRRTLYQIVLALVQNDHAFKTIHNRFKNRKENPLKPKESFMALSSKFLRVFFAMVKYDTDYDGDKMLGDIIYPKAKKENAA